MAYVGRDFDVCDVVEVEPYAFDFVNTLNPQDSIVGAVWSVEVAPGQNPDPNASARLVGTPWFLSPTQTAQILQGGIAGVTYIVQAVCKTAFGYTVSLYSHSRCEVLN